MIIFDIIIVRIGNSAYEGLIHKRHEYNKSQYHFFMYIPYVGSCQQMCSVTDLYFGQKQTSMEL